MCAHACVCVCVGGGEEQTDWTSWCILINLSATITLLQLQIVGDHTVVYGYTARSQPALYKCL